MVDWIILIFGVLLLAAGLWQYRTPEETQELFLRGAKRPWQRKLFASDQYHGLVGLNGLFLYGCQGRHFWHFRGMRSGPQPRFERDGAGEKMTSDAV